VEVDMLEDYVLGYLGAALLGWLIGHFIGNLLLLARMIVRDIRKWRGSR
jgi:hypothetical protein